MTGTGTISGKVTDATGKALPSVAIQGLGRMYQDGHVRIGNIYINVDFVLPPGRWITITGKTTQNLRVTNLDVALIVD